MRKIASIFVVLFLAASAFGRDEVFRRSFPTEPGKPVTVDFRDVDGDVRVEAHQLDEIVFEFTKTITGSPSRGRELYFKDIRPEVGFTSNRFQAEIIYPKRGFLTGLFGSSRIRVRSVIKVPAKCGATVRLVDGDAVIAGLEGRTEVKTTDGDIRVQDCRGEARLRTVDGDIEVLGSAGRLQCDTVDGEVAAEGRFHDVLAESTDGDIELRFLRGSRIEAGCRVRTVDGDVRIALPGDMDFRLRAASGEGRISSGIRFDRVSVQRSHRLEAERGRGGGLIAVDTGDGDIAIRED